MSRTKGGLFKTTVVIWSEFDPQTIELSGLAREAETGDAYCAMSVVKFVKDPRKDKDWDGTDFFGPAFEGRARKRKRKINVPNATGYPARLLAFGGKDPHG